MLRESNVETGGCSERKNEGREQRRELERNATYIANMTIFSERGEESREGKDGEG